MLDVWPDLQAKGVRWIKTSELFFFNVFNSLLTQCTRSIRRHLGEKKSKKENFLRIDFHLQLFFKTQNITDKYCICFHAQFIWIKKSVIWSCFFDCLILSKTICDSPQVAWGSKSCRCLLIRHSPNSLTAVARAAQYKPKKSKLLYLASKSHLPYPVNIGY